ncbi:histidine phosphatase family protein [Paenibacillus rhizovicinus]|uniref:Histidine phosphatase family protein n=1 Tax=Paenibacillus rhizovicinus TaxID=2704463 RepID=A0A6C0NU66_9BACL|nr:histidine phosphatase family protein [Paenibacillus rhizovicinus]QHW29707.1 histidine phosphatase family protein [Paenibacillus rhizovicinus]
MIEIRKTNGQENVIALSKNTSIETNRRVSLNFYVVRHCKALGQSPAAKLTDEGYKQAVRLAEWLSDKKIERIISSPYDRAIQSMIPLASQLAITVDTDLRLAERVLCAEDHPRWREMLRSSFLDLDLRYEGGESSRAAMMRAAAVVDELRSSGHANVVLATHGNLMTLLLKVYDRDRFGFEQWAALTNPDVFHLEFQEDLPVIRREWLD